MIRTTPFHERVEALNETGLYSHWAGHLVAEKYQMSEKFEHSAIRNSAGLFDTSPLFKYRITGPDAERYLSGVMARDIRTCRVGRAQYTIWCDDDGYVLEDGLIMRLSEDEYLLTAVGPNLAYLDGLVGSLEVQIIDVSLDVAGLALQGPRSRAILSAVAPQAEGLAHFAVTHTEMAGVAVTVSRTGYTGDLGYELWAPAEAATEVWDAVWEAGRGHGLVPVGQIALLMARIEAGLLLLDVDFQSARHAWTPAQRSTPLELGLGWMVRDLGGDRPFVGRDAIRAERDDATSRWALAGLVVDWRDWDRLHDEAGLVPPKDHLPVHTDIMVYDHAGERAGWASSSMYSPILQRHIALARVRPDLAPVGTRVALEVTIEHRHHTVAAEVVRLPFYAPDRTTA